MNPTPARARWLASTVPSAPQPQSVTRLPSKRALARLAELREPDLPAVTVERLDGHRSSSRAFPGNHDTARRQPPATAGMMLTSSLAATGVARSSR